MDRDDFIIAVYCLVCEHYQAVCAALPHRLRRGGFAPQLSDEEVITIEVCGEYFKMNSDKDIFAYFHTHYQHFFPRLKERTAFVRQAANLWQLNARLQHRLTQVSGAASDSVQVIDTLPLPVCLFTRSCRDRCFVGEADYGYCAAKKLTYYGFKLGLRTARCGMITHYPLLWARPHDVRHLQTLTEAFEGVVPADKGFIDPFEQTLLSVRHGVQVVVPQRQNMKKPSPHAPELLRACARWRKQIETVGSHLTERFAVARIRVHDLWHFQHRLIRKVLAHTVLVFLNLQLKRPPLDLDGIVSL
jgi:Transposase DDE domain